jgi:hypothetical protein
MTSCQDVTQSAASRSIMAGVTWLSCYCFCVEHCDAAPRRGPQQKQRVRFGSCKFAQLAKIVIAGPDREDNSQSASSHLLQELILAFEHLQGGQRLRLCPDTDTPLSTCCRGTCMAHTSCSERELQSLSKAWAILTPDVPHLATKRQNRIVPSYSEYRRQSASHLDRACCPLWCCCRGKSY